MEYEILADDTAAEGAAQDGDAPERAAAHQFSAEPPRTCEICTDFIRAPPAPLCTEETHLQQQVFLLLEPSLIRHRLAQLTHVPPLYTHVYIMGLHKSGTHALGAYVREYFSINLQPDHTEPLLAGTVVGDNFKLWKHTVPLERVHLPTPPALPDGTPGRVLLLLTIRDPASWLASLSKEPYEFFPVPRRVRRLHTIEWMLGRIQVCSHMSYDDPFSHRCFDSMLDLWAHYAHGYITGKLLPQGLVDVKIVRYEDVVERPKEVVDALEEIGVKRNATEFATIEKPVTKRSLARKDIIARETSFSVSQPGADDNKTASTATATDAQSGNGDAATQANLVAELPGKAKRAVAERLARHRVLLDKLDYWLHELPDAA